MDTETVQLSQQPGLAPNKNERFSPIQLLIFLVLIVYVIHVIMGWPYALIWWPWQTY